MLTSLDNPLTGISLRTAGWIVALWLAPLVLVAAAALALPHHRKRDE